MFTMAIALLVRNDEFFYISKIKKDEEMGNDDVSFKVHLKQPFHVLLIFSQGHY